MDLLEIIHYNINNFQSQKILNINKQQMTDYKDSNQIICYRNTLELF